MKFSFPSVLVTVVLLFFLHLTTSAEWEKNICTKHLHTLAAKQALFVECSTLHSVPVKLCISCEEPYSEMQQAYEDLRSEPNCTEKYFDKDRINIVSTTQSILAGLWERAYCPDCFITNNSYVFNLKTIELDDCLNDANNKGKECGACLPYYSDLNHFYTTLDEHNNGKVCYDIQDSMNRTRVNWSKKLNCCHREFNILPFAIFGSFAALLPVLFYGSMVVITKRQERNHELLIEDAESYEPPRPTPTTSTTRTRAAVATTEPSYNSIVAASPLTTTAIINNPAGSSTSTSFPPTKVINKKAQFNFDSDSSEFDSDLEVSNTKTLSPKVNNKND